MLLVCPGIVYRRDAIDWQHTGTPRQLDLWRITRRPMRGADLDQDADWVEVWECGLAHPGELAAAGLPGRSGLALGLGLDRLLMLAKRIPDIRLLRSGDPRVAGSCMTSPRTGWSRRCPRSPGTCRSPSPPAMMRRPSATASAIARLGARPEQKNLLVRVVLRDLDQTLTNEAANDLRDRIYRALHQGTEYEWTR